MSLQLGNFMVESGEILVCDPCYDDAEHMHITLPAHNGKWWTSIERYEDRISRLYAVLDKTQLILTPRDVGVAGVDSGQMGIYDKPYFNNQDKVEGGIANFKDWYLMCCDRTLGDVGAGLIPHGVVSSSGWGDGAYQVRADYCGRKIIYVEIIFIDESWKEDAMGEAVVTEEDKLGW
jgi:hypothetical protein